MAEESSNKKDNEPLLAVLSAGLPRQPCAPALILEGNSGAGLPEWHPLIYASTWTAFGRPLRLLMQFAKSANCTCIRFSQPR
ncbi:MAG TPA: hypothetical protein PLC52_00725 [Anaerolineales bacterium]|nr:hypothetical protein [Anaerolineales bacterium]HRQ91376.1 hypothetical protein [Anaerolineales bacterium]